IRQLYRTHSDHSGSTVAVNSWYVVRLDRSEASLGSSTGCQPRSSTEPERLIPGTEALLEVGLQRRPAVGRQRGHIRTGGRNAELERLPQILKTLIAGCDNYLRDGDPVQISTHPQRFEFVWGAVPHRAALIEVGCVRGERGYRIPEAPQHCHLARVIPYGRRDSASGLSYPPHFAHAGLGIAHEVHHKLGERP